MLPDLRSRATEHELMDDPECDRETLERTYAWFGMVNAIVGCWGTVYRREVRPRRRARPLRVLDIGTGGGDVPRALSRWARRDGIELELVGIDPEARAIDWARRHTRDESIEFRHARSGELVDAGESFDLVISNHVLHHLDGHELGRILADSERLVAPGGLALHSDLARGRLAYLAFAIGTAPLERTLLKGTFIRSDGLTSIRRAHTARELAHAVPSGWSVRTGFPARLELRWEP